MIEKNVTFEGILREEEEGQNGIVWHALVMADFTGRDGTEQSWAIDIKPGGNPLGATTVVTTLAMSVPKAIIGTVSIGTDGNKSIVLADADVRKTVGKKNIAPSKLPFMPGGGEIKLFGACTDGKIAIWLSGITYIGDDLLRSAIK